MKEVIPKTIFRVVKWKVKRTCISADMIALSFLLFALQNQRTGGWNRFCPEAGGGGGDQERDRKMNMVQIMYSQVSKCKNDTC
jgi:hypothetical protein